ncbi:Ser Thr kinase [Cryptosporidium sp. chipmunk genotype I]|uniref:Ser Thr kinase n=1 Tax=Cryptosporidium sp. chipmunk genotype I TaxID=1280935 RepID=UPI003519E598|nr:Ser Thr kinase [Cryptosporidium sp. chipmunk genotype I]
MEKEDENEEFVEEYINTNVILIPRSPSRPEVFEVEDFSSIHANEIIAINAIYGSVTIHNDMNGSIKELLEDQGELINFSKEAENEFNNKDGVEIRVLFIPGKDEDIDKELEKSKYLVNLSYEGNSFTVYSLILSRSLSETMPFKNRRYWRRTHLYARLTVYYDEKYPTINPGLLFEFSLELPESINIKLIEEIQEILVNRSRDQECIFQVINSLEMILDNLCDYLQISEDLWEQMRRQNNQREFERHLDNSVINEDNGNNFMDNEELGKLIDLKASESNHQATEINDNYEKLNNKTVSEMVSGFLDDTILDYPLNTNEITEENNISNVIIKLDLSYIQKEILEHNINYSLFSSKRFTQDFRVLEILHSGKNVIITKSIHLIDQNNYQISIYRIPSNKFNKIQTKVSSLVMLQHRYMVRYYQCWVEKCDDTKDERNDQEDFILLYIQSEFMEENMTLFDLFDKGKITQRDNHVVWSLFRQILEILSYCHRNEVFHLNLSSNCIYIEEDIYGYSVKLSNFIFGSYLNLDFDNNYNEFSLPKILFKEINQLNNELLIIDVDYTCQIFLEMWLRIKFKGLEYVKFSEILLDWLGKLKMDTQNLLSIDITKSIEDLSVFNIEVPMEFKYIPKNALLIMGKLNNIKDKTSIDDLLKSDLLPSSIDKNEFQYYLSRICNPKTYESHLTLNTLFGRSIDRKSFTAFLMDIQSDERVNMIDLTFSDIVKTSISKVFDDHNFVLWKLPILYPTQFLMDKRIDTVNNNKEFENILCECGYRTRTPHFLLDISNNLLCLPKSAPFSMISSLVSLLLGDHYNERSGYIGYSTDFENKIKKSSGIDVDGNNCTSNCGFKTSRILIDDFNNDRLLSGNSGISSGLCYRDFSMDILEDSPIQRYVLFPIYEQPNMNTEGSTSDNNNNNINNSNINNNVFGPPRAKLSLAFDMIYQLNEPDLSIGSGLFCSNNSDLNFSNLNLDIKRLLINQTGSNSLLLYQDLKRIYQLNGNGQIVNMENIILEVEGLLLSLKLILPWLDYLEDVPVVRITIPLMAKIVYLELLEKMQNNKLREDDIAKRRGLDLFTQKSIFKETYNNKGRKDINEKLKKKEEKNKEEDNKEEEEIEREKKREEEEEKEREEDIFIRDLFLEMHAFEWKYESNNGNYKLKSVYENNFIMRSYEYIRDNQIIKLYVQVVNEILNLLSESTELLIYKGKKVKFYLDPIMDYDINLYDQTSLVYSITSEKQGINIIYGMGGSYSNKINGITNSSYLNSLNSNNNNNNGNSNYINIGGLGISKFQNSLNCIMGEISIELIINQVCEKAKRYKSEFVNTGGYINGISVNDISMMNNGGFNLSILSNERNFGMIRRSSWEGFNSNNNINIIKKDKNVSISDFSHGHYQSGQGNLEVNKFSLRGSGVNEYEEMTDLTKELVLKPISLLKSCYPRVIVMTQTARLQPKVLSLTRRLWQKGIRSEYRLTPVRSLTIFLEKLKRDTLVELLIVVMFQNSNVALTTGGAMGGTGISNNFLQVDENPNLAHNVSNIGTQEGYSGGGSHHGGGISVVSSTLGPGISTAGSGPGPGTGALSGPGAVLGTGTGVGSGPALGPGPGSGSGSGQALGTGPGTGTGSGPVTSTSGVGVSSFSDNIKNKNVIFRIEPISGFYYETIGLHGIKVIMENEENVVNYVLTKRKRQLIN